MDRPSTLDAEFLRLELWRPVSISIVGVSRGRA
jgi:hypothetical protein